MEFGGLSTVNRQRKIYKAINHKNGKVYIGQTILSLPKRIWFHNQAAESCYDVTVFHKAIHKYGKDSFEWNVLALCENDEELNNLEVKFIKELNSKIPFGYNMTDGGENRSGINNPMFGKKQSDYCRAVNRKMRIGQKQPQKLIEKRLSKIRGDNHYLRNGSEKGKKFLEKLKRRLLQNNPSCRYIWVIKSKQFGIEESLNLRDWCNEHGLHYNSARNAFYNFGYHKQFVVVGRKLC